MDPLTIAAICTLILKNEAAITAVPPDTDCARVDREQQANAARATQNIDGIDDREAIGRVAYHEAANQGDRGIAAVVYTIINRFGSGRFGRTVSDVLNAPRQFEPVARAGGSWRMLSPAPKPIRRRIDAIVSLALKGDLADETGGALYFQNAKIVAARERAGTVSRGLTNFGGLTPSATIGDHSFYTGSRFATGQTTGVVASRNGDQEDYINAGGEIFGSDVPAAFDPSKASASGGRAGTTPAKPEAVGQGVATSGEPASPVVEPSTKPAEDVGGMFVLSTGKTSSAPPQ